MQQHFHASHKGVALNPSVYAQPWAVWPCGGGTRPGEARIWGADQPRSTCVERTYDWTHMQTRKHTHTYAYTHTSPFPASSSFPAPPVVLVTACRACHCHSSWSPPVVHVTAMCAALPCCHACSPSAPRWCCVGRAAWRCLQSLMMTQIDGWTRGAVKRMAHHAVSRKWKWELADFWLLFLKLSNKLMNE